MKSSQILEHSAVASPMDVGVTHEGKRSVYQFSEPVLISKVLEKMDIPPSTVLTVVEQKIVPHTSTITGDLEIELIIVSSGG